MKALSFVFACLLIVGLPSIAISDGGIDLGQGPAGGDYGSPREDLVDEWNADEAYSSAGTYSGGCFAYPYDPPIDYILERVEFLAGGLGGQVRVQVRADDPNGTVLGEVTYQESANTDWQGENLVPAVSLVSGSTYYVIYDVVPGADASSAASGVIIPYFYGSDCATYNGPFESVYWKARFYGTTAIPTEESSWGRIRGLYR